MKTKSLLIAFLLIGCLGFSYRQLVQLTTVPSAGGGVTTYTIIPSPVPSTSLRSDYSGLVGFCATATRDLTITKLGRWVVSGNSQTHTVYVYSGDYVGGVNSSTTVLGSVTVNTSGATVGEVLEVVLSSPISVASGATITVVSEETSGGDQWYERGVYTFSADFTACNYAYGSAGFLQNDNVVNPNNSGVFVPVNAVYTVP
jgi:hypothetical protein